MNTTTKLLVIIMLAISYSDLTPFAATYTWEDSNGTTHFTDNRASIPATLQKKVKSREDITINNPNVRASLEESQKRATEIERVDKQRSAERQARETAEERELALKQSQALKSQNDNIDSKQDKFPVPVAPGLKPKDPQSTKPAPKPAPKPAAAPPTSSSSSAAAAK